MVSLEVMDSGTAVATTTFADRLAEAVGERRSQLVVGLDPRLDLLPLELRGDAGKAVDAVLETITDTLKRRDQINFTGFGKFATSERKARMGVNPRNPGEKVHIPAATVPKFTAGSSLKQSVRGG